ncbi:MAG: hypothetical protein H6Q64_1682, partial [Firmicutes bacterium]|nr:hypothetical protein [Bacillota bacterium]
MKRNLKKIFSLMMAVAIIFVMLPVINAQAIAGFVP